MSMTSTGDMQQQTPTLEATQSSFPATNSSETSQMDLDSERAKNIQLAAEVEMLNGKLATYREALGEHKRLLTESVDNCRAELSQVKSALREAAKTTSAEIESQVSLVARSALALESQLQRDVAQAQLAASALLHDEHQRELDEIKMEIQNEKRKVYEAEKRCGHIEALVQQKDDVIALLEERAAATEKELKDKINEAQAEVVKQLTIEYELLLDGARDDAKKMMQMKETERLDM
uniref:Uncharacterized protein n=1 Tax=Plectus sambesii TaxID=2011161 RepID=A0A914UX84_9BILA